ncbi:MAG: thioesterase family protein [Acidobacteriota bacterium]
MAFTSVQKIRFDDVDGAGIVYYPKYFGLCHSAFEDFFDSAAPISYPEMIRDRRQGFPTVAIQSDFTAPLEYGDTAIVALAVATLGRSSVSFTYTVRRKRDGARCFGAVITTVFIDLDTRESVEIPPEFRRIFSAFLTPVEGPKGSSG